MYGWFGKILRVDLTRETVAVEEVDPRMAKDFIGGRGWAIKILYDEVDPRVEPLAPENKLIFGTGPLTGTPAPTGNRYMLVTKSPLIGALSCSNSGGMFPTEMKRTGFDLFVIEGRATRPVYLWVNDDEVEIRAGRFRSVELVLPVEEIEDVDPEEKLLRLAHDPRSSQLPARSRLRRLDSFVSTTFR